MKEIQEGEIQLSRYTRQGVFRLVVCETPLHLSYKTSPCVIGQLGIWRVLNAEAETDKTDIILYFMKFVALECTVHQAKVDFLV